MKLNRIEKVYVCHYTKLVDRVDVLKEQLSKYDIDAEWVTTADKEDIDMIELEKWMYNVNNTFSLPGHIRKLKMSEISLMLKHYSIWVDMIENNINDVLILEDDALLADDFVNRFNEYTKNIDNDYDLVWVGSCCNLHVNDIDNTHLVRTNSSRCTHGYTMSLKVAKLLVDNIKHNNYPVDFYFNYMIDKYKLRNYWMEPDLISQNPKFETSIQNG